MAQPNTHCQYFRPATRAPVSSQPITPALAQLRGDVGDRRIHLGLGPAHDLGDGALADRHAEHVQHQGRQTLVADGVDGVQVDHRLLDAAPERRAGLQARRRLRVEALPAARTRALVLMHAGDVRAHRRDLDAVVAELEGLMRRADVAAAARAVVGRRGDRTVRVRLQRARLALATLARLAGLAFTPFVRLLVLRRRAGGVPRRLARLVQPGLDIRNALFEREDVVDQLVLGMLLQFLPPSHTILESHPESWGQPADTERAVQLTSPELPGVG
ncbi:MAG: hypothetical protein U5L06_06640 [Rhodovibrio sp.]|nr:hypothetical protein [Rhodovibrio sp.]